MKILRLIMSALMLWTVFAAWSYDFEDNGIYYNIDLANRTCSVTHGDTKYSGDIVIPEAALFRGTMLPVTDIGDSAFKDCTSLTSVNVPNSVTKIGDYAFNGCTSFTSIDIPNSVTTIGPYAFYGCASLTSIDIPNSVAEIGDYAFNGCTSLASINIPNSITRINRYVFNRCIGLTRVNIPNSVTTISIGAFYGCTSLASINIPNSVEIIQSRAFAECSSLKKIVFESGINKYLSAYRDSFAVPAEEVYLGRTLPRYDGVYENWKQTLKILTIAIADVPGGNLDLEGFNALRTLTIEDCVAEFQAYGLETCTGITEVYCKGVVPPSANEFSHDTYLNATVYVPEEAVEAYRNAPVWKKFWEIKGATSGISDVVVDSADDKEPVIYDLMGRRLETPQKGLNIINGKKVFVK